MMNNIKLSLVFCCYNVAKYLDDIYLWLCEQPYKNIEVIFVEDCATDNTKEKLFTLVNDPRMRIIENEKNLGLSESRNVGLRNATGDYIGFPDPDDMFDQSWLEEIAQVINLCQPKVIIAGMREDYENSEHLKYSKEILSSFSGYIENENILPVLINLEETFLLGYMNNKFYDREFLVKNNLSCKNLALKEDFEFNINVFRFLDNFYILNKPYYFYKKRINGSTLTSKFVPDYFDIHMGTLFLFKDLVESKYHLTENVEKLLVNRFVRYFLSAVERNTNEASNLTSYAQKVWVNNVLSDKKYSYFLERLNLLTGKVKFLRCILTPGSSSVLVLLGKSIKYIKLKLPILFAKLK